MYEMPDEIVLISGVFERIGMEGSFYTIKLNGEKIKKDCVLKNHEEAVKILTEELMNYNVVKDLHEIGLFGKTLDKEELEFLFNKDCYLIQTNSIVTLFE